MDQISRQTKKYRLLHLGYWLFWLAVMIFIHSSHDLNPDEGVVLNGAWNLQNGLEPYKDFFEFITPGSFYLIHWVWNIFGANFYVARFTAVLFLFAATFGIYKISERLRPNQYNLLIAPIFSFFSSWFWLANHNFFSLTAAIWSAYFFILALTKNEKRNFFISGLFSGLTCLFLQQKGLAVIASGSAFLFIFWLSQRSWKNLKNIVIYLFSSFSPLLILLHWPLQILWQNLIIFPISGYGNANEYHKYWFALCLAIIAVLAFNFWQEKEKRKEIWFLFTLQFFLIISCWPLPDPYHLGASVFPLFSLFLYILTKEKGGKSFAKRLHLFLAITLFSVLTIIPSLSFFAAYLNPFGFQGKTLIKTIQKNCPGQYFFAGPFISGLYFETGKLNATSYSFLITGQNSPEQFSTAVQELKKNRPSCAFYWENNLMKKRFNHDKNNEVENYLRAEYHIIYQDDNGAIIYQIK